MLNFNRVTQAKINALFMSQENDLHFSGVLGCEGNMPSGEMSYRKEAEKIWKQHGISYLSLNMGNQNKRIFFEIELPKTREPRVSA